MGKGCLHSVWIGWIKFCRIINDAIEDVFEAHTRAITRHHNLTIVISLMFVAVMAIGAVRFKSLERNEELFIPQESRGFADLDKADKYFPEKFRVNEFIVSTADGGNVFESNVAFKEALRIHKQVVKIKNFGQVCLTHAQSGSCFFVSSLEVFNYSEENINDTNTSDKLRALFNGHLSNADRLLSNGRPAFLNYRNILGSYTGNNTHVRYSDAVRMTYYMKYVSTKDDDYAKIMTWEDEFLELCKNQPQLVDLKLNYFAARTRDDSVLESTIGDLPLFSVAFILMVAFCLVVFVRIKNPVTGHLVVGIAGIFVIMLGIGSGFGLAMWAGIDFVAFTGILLFLVLGIGMDNMFIIVDGIEEVDADIQGPERIVIAMRHIGGSITMTTSTDLVAFAVSTVTDFPSIKLFCAYASLSVLFAYLGLITLFIAILTWDVKRIEQGKRDIFPCCIAKNPPGNPWLKTDIAFSKKARVLFEICLVTRILSFLAKSAHV